MTYVVAHPFWNMVAAAARLPVKHMDTKHWKRVCQQLDLFYELQALPLAYLVSDMRAYPSKAKSLLP